MTTLERQKQALQNLVNALDRCAQENIEIKYRGLANHIASIYIYHTDLDDSSNQLKLSPQKTEKG